MAPERTVNRPVILYLIAILQILLLSYSCMHDRTGLTEPATTAKLNVYFFHLTARCEACNAIEANTANVLDTHFKNQMNNGTIFYRPVNIESRDNRALAKKYQISYTSLLLVRADGTVTDLTIDAMNYALMNPVKFKDMLRAEIEKNLE